MVKKRQKNPRAVKNQAIFSKRCEKIVFQQRINASLNLVLVYSSLILYLDSDDEDDGSNPTQDWFQRHIFVAVIFSIFHCLDDNRSINFT